MAGRLAIGRLRLSHFRSYAQAEAEFSPGPIAVFGNNGAGKTNLLEAISLLSPGRGLRRAKPDDIARNPDRIGWRVTADIESRGDQHEVQTGAEFGNARSVTINDKTVRQAALGQIARLIWLVPVMDRLWLEGASDRRQFLDRITLSLMPDHGAAVIAYEKAMRDRNRLLKDGTSDAAWFAALEAQMAQQGAAITANRTATLIRLAAAQNGAETSFPHASLRLEGSGPSDVDHLAEVLAAGRSADLAAGRTLTGPHRADLIAVYSEKEVEARLCSTGEQKALLVSLILSNARAVAEDFGAPPVLLLDEIAAHLDADRREALYREITALGAQAFMTGTGRELYDPLEGQAQFWEIREGDGGTILKEA